MKKVLSTYWLPSLLGLMPAIFWAPNEFSFMLLFCFAPIIVWGMKRANLGELFFGIYLFYLTFDLASLRWVWSIDFPIKGWVIALIVLAILPAIQVIPIHIGIALVTRFKRVFLLLVIPVFAVLLELLNSEMFLGFPWLNPSLALGSSFLKPLGGQVVGLIGLTFFLFVSNVGTVLIYVASNNLRRGIGMVIVILSVIVTFMPIANEPRTEQLVVLSAYPTFNPYSWAESELYDHSRHVLEAIDIAKEKGADLVVFPEGYLRDFGQRPLYANDLNLNPAVRDIRSACLQTGVSVVVGGIAKRMYETDHPPTSTALKEGDQLYSDLLNIIFIIDDTGGIQYRAKSKLVPFMERAPFMELSKKFDFLKMSMNSSPRSYHGDEELSLFEWHGRRLLPLICYESLSISDSKNFQSDRADLMIAVSNEAWASNALMSDQHKMYDRAVASSLGIDLVRSVALQKAEHLHEGIPTSFGYVQLIRIH